MATEQQSQAWPQAPREPLLDRAKAVALRWLDRALTGMADPEACPNCRGSLTLLDDQLIQWNEVGLLHGIRFWECPSCQYSTGQCYSYLLRDGEFWAWRCC
jgi:hypothetical protein